jgi:hypothetical protein
MASTSTATVPSSPTRTRTRHTPKEEFPTEDIVTQEMLKEESELHKQQDLGDLSSKVLPSPANSVPLLTLAPGCDGKLTRDR